MELQGYNSFYKPYLASLPGHKLEDLPVVSADELAAKRGECEVKFDDLQREYARLFHRPEIRQATQGESFPPMIDVEQEEIAIEYTKDCKGLSTSGVGECLAVMGRAKGKLGPCIGLSHTGGFTFHPEELLQEMIKLFKNKGCDENTIQFYIVGGQLPYVDGRIADSIEAEEEFLKLSSKYPIAGVEFNCAEGSNSLEVVITADKIVWQREYNTKNSSSNDSSSSSEEQEINKNLKRKAEEEQENSVKKQRPEPLKGLLSGEAPDFV